MTNSLGNQPNRQDNSPQQAASDPGTSVPTRPITITLDTQQPGPAVPADFAGLSFERGPLNPGNAGVTGYLFNPGNTSLVTLFRNLGLGNLRIGGGSVDTMIPAGTGPDGFTGIDNLFAFAEAAGVSVLYSLRLLNPSSKPIPNLQSIDAMVAGHIWQRYRPSLSSFAIGNEPDFHSYHTYPGHPLDPCIYETVPGVPGSAYPSYLADWQGFAAAVAAAAPGARLSGPDTGAYSTLTYTPNPQTGVSWTQRFAVDERPTGQIADVTQHYYVGGGPGGTTAQQAIDNMLSPNWVHASAPGSQPTGTTYTPYPWLYTNILAPAAATGLPCRLTESNDYLTGIAGASNAYASALWALDYLHWWASRGAAGVNFHNKQWLATDTIVPAGTGAGYATAPKGYGIKAFTLGSSGRVTPVAVTNASGMNLTAYCVGTAAEQYLTIINKSQGAGAATASVTIPPPAPGLLGAQTMTLAGGTPGDASGTVVTLGGATITGDAPWQGAWSPVATAPAGLRVVVRATSAVIVRMQTG